MLIATGILFLLGLLMGLIRGALRITVGLIASIFSFVIVIFLSPKLETLLIEKTPLDDVIARQVSDAVEDKIRDSVREQVERTMQEQGLLSGDETSDKQKEAMLEQAIDDMMALDLTAEQKQKLIENSSIPKVFKPMLLTGNALEETDAAPEEGAVDPNGEEADGAEVTEDGETAMPAKKTGIYAFTNALGNALAGILIHVLAFLLAYLLIRMAIRVVMYVSSFMDMLPVLGVLNHILGGLMGLLGALIIVWFLYLIITLLAAAGIGVGLYESIVGHPILNLIYQTNIIQYFIVK